MTKKEPAEIYAEYDLFFRDEEPIARSSVSIDEGLEDIEAVHHTLDEIVKNIPYKEEWVIGSHGFGPYISYKEQINDVSDLTKIKEILHYLLKMPKEHKPMIIHIENLPNKSCKEKIEFLLNQYGKTLMPSKEVQPPGTRLYDKIAYSIFQRVEKNKYGIQILDTG